MYAFTKNNTKSNLGNFPIAFSVKAELILPGGEASVEIRKIGSSEIKNHSYQCGYIDASEYQWNALNKQTPFCFINDEYSSL